MACHLRESHPPPALIIPHPRSSSLVLHWFIVEHWFIFILSHFIATQKRFLRLQITDSSHLLRDLNPQQPTRPPRPEYYINIQIIQRFWREFDHFIRLARFVSLSINCFCSYLTSTTIKCCEDVCIQDSLSVSQSVIHVVLCGLVLASRSAEVSWSSLGL